MSQTPAVKGLQPFNKLLIMITRGTDICQVKANLVCRTLRNSMNQTGDMKNMKEYYRHIGRLAYAVAMADGAVQEEEIMALRQSVIRDFAVHESNVDSSGMNQAFYVDFAFEECLEKKTDKNEILRQFSEYMDLSAENSDVKLLERSVKLLRKIAGAYSKNREELIIETVTNKINKVLQQ